MKLHKQKLDLDLTSKHVLHVTDCLNAGVGEIIHQLCRQGARQDISILWDSHSDAPTSNISFDLFQSNQNWDKGFLKRILKLRRVVNEINPDVIHAHSSIAGFYVRLFTFGRIKIYSPHCFSFDRLDVNPSTRLFYFLIELLLHQFTNYYVVNWPIEAIEVSKFKPNKKIYFLRPEITNFNWRLHKKISNQIQIQTFISVGRIRPQKDPEFFASVAKEFNKVSSAQFIWIGSGDKNTTEKLMKAGVQVIPWISSDELINYYEKATATLITSKWESGPLTLFESLNYSTPVIVRANKSSKLYGIPVFHSPSEFVEECLRITNLESTKNLVREQREKSLSSIEKLMSSKLVKQILPD